MNSHTNLQKISINKYKAAILIFIIIGPVIDLLTGYFQLGLSRTSELTPGIVYRGLILTPIFLILIHLLKPNYLRLFVQSLIFLFVLGMTFHVLANYEINFFGDLQRFIKLLFPILGFGAILFLEKKYPNRQVERFLWLAAGLYGLLTAVSIVLLFFAGEGVSTYRYGFSFKGYFDSQNSFGYIFITSLLCCLFYIYKFKHNNLVLILSVEALFLLAAFLVGTRAALIGVPFAILLFHGVSIFAKRFSGRIPPIIYGIILLIGGSVVALLIYNFWVQQDVDYILGKFGKLAIGDFRQTVPLGIEQILKFNLIEHLFGVGEAEFTLRENDFVDIYGKFGLLILVLLLMFFAYLYVKLLYIFIFRKKTLSSFILLISLTFYIGHAAIAGHSLAIAQTNNLVMLIYFLTYKQILNQSRTGLNPVAQIASETSTIHQNEGLIITD